MRTAILAMCAAGVMAACESDSLFEGEPAIAPPVVEFDLARTSSRAIHGGTLPVSLTASDAHVGVDSVVVRYTGALNGSFTRRFPAAPRNVQIDTTLAVPFGVEGDVVFEAIALNRFRAVSGAETVTVPVVREDTINPATALQAPTLPARVEMRDTLRVRVRGQDDAFGSGIARIGVVVEDATSPLAITYSISLANPLVADTVISIAVADLPGDGGARVRDLRIIGFAIDQAGNCTAVGAAGTPVDCTAPNGEPAVQGVAGVAAGTEVTGTRSLQVASATAADIGDLVVDPARGVLYVSNQINNSIERVSWTGAQLASTGRALVGARPWGMTIDRSRDTLIVANSGSTTLSYVALGPFAERQRFATPNAALWQLTGSDQGGTVLTHHDFSDRPQHVAQDRDGVVLYSTAPTSAAAGGSIRTVQWNSAWMQRESDMLLWTQVVDGNGWGPGAQPRPCWDEVTRQNVHDDPACVIAFVDSVRIHYESPMLGTQLRVYDHVPGRPQQVIADTSGNWYQLVTRLRAKGSDIFMHRGEWKLDEWLNADTTFVVASGNGSWVGIAEGARNPGRMWMWGAIGPHPRLFDRWISDVVNIADYTNNTASTINSVSANTPGDVFATRGSGGAFFFTTPMRMLGSYNGPGMQGGIGVALHPEARFSGGDQNANWAALGTTEAEVILVDLLNFRRIGRIALVEPVGGPLRVIGRQQGDAPTVVAHIFGVSSSGRIFAVPVRTTDIQR